LNEKVFMGTDEKLNIFPSVMAYREYVEMLDKKFK